MADGKITLEQREEALQRASTLQPMYPLYKPETILESAARLTADETGERREAYGPPFQEAEDVAAMFTAVTGMPFKPEHFHLLMICLKLHREGHRAKRDNRVDICGWTKVYDDFLAERDEVEDARKLISEAL